MRAGVEPVALVGALAVALAVLLAGYAVVSPGRGSLALSRRRPGAAPAPGLLSHVTARTTALIEQPLRRGGRDVVAAGLLERAGIRQRPAEVVLLVVAGALVAAALGLLASGPLLALVLALLAPLLARLLLSTLAARRQKAFAEQLEDSLQLLASSLRAGHSLLQALDAVSHEAEEPSREEFTRVINETRVGRDLGSALAATAARMASQDLDWVTQAIAINREVGGNLAEVLDRVGTTIRERGQLSRQVKALSSEGRLSAYILMALPIAIAGFLSFSNPGYIGTLTQSLAGMAMIGAALVMLLVGGLWLRKIVSFKF